MAHKLRKEVVAPSPYPDEERSRASAARHTALRTELRHEPAVPLVLVPLRRLDTDIAPDIAGRCSDSHLRTSSICSDAATRYSEK